MSKIQPKLVCKLKEIEYKCLVKVRDSAERVYWRWLDDFSSPIIDRQEVLKRLKAKMKSAKFIEAAVWALYDYNARVCLAVFHFSEQELTEQNEKLKGESNG